MTSPALQTSIVPLFTDVQMNDTAFRAPTRQLIIPYNFHHRIVLLSGSG